MNIKYKVLTIKPKKKIIANVDLDHEEIEKALNEYGEKGCKLIGLY